jgi:general secretion pathway protein A
LYHDFYQLEEKPFQITSNPAFHFLSRSHKEALAIITFGVEQGKGLIVIVGENGLGKTTLLHAYLKEMERAEKKIICLFNGNFSFIGLLKTIARKLELEVKSNEFSLLLIIREALIKENEKGANLVLLFDDAQDLPIETLERIRLFTNLETSKRKLIQVVLVGRPELESKLNLQELRQLKQRIVLKTTLSPLKKDESLDYIKFRLETAGERSSSIFTKKAMEKIVRYSKGIPRIINVVCHNAMVMSYTSFQKRVSVKIVKEVITIMDGKENRFTIRLVSASITAILLGVGILGFFTYYNSLTAQNDLHSSTLFGLEKPAQVFIAEINKKDNPPPVTMTNLIVNKEIITPGRRKTLLNQKIISMQSGNPSSINRLQVANEKPFLGKKASELKRNEGQFPVIKKVRKGDNLYRLTLDVYGISNQELSEFVKKYNPKIKDKYGIQVGEKIIFPYWKEKRKEG